MHNNSSLNFSKIAVLIVAAGRGKRAGGGLPKQYRLLGGEMVLSRTLRCFTGHSPIVVAIHPDDVELFEQASANITENITDDNTGEITMVQGGVTRTGSVKAGLEALAPYKPDIVLIHDAARPYLSTVVIDNVLGSLSEHRAVAPALPIVDALKSLDGSPVDRDQFKRVQTPQGFHFEDILNAYSEIDKNADFVDDIEIARQNGLSIGFCAGDPANIKLTFEQDFNPARQTAIPEDMSMINITGSGYDVHRICAGDSVFLCGVEIEAGFALKGHSDADVGLHALTDALLGAISAGDIGDHFPPSDPKWKNANSVVFLAHAAKLVTEHGGIIDHVDVTLICEAPKISPHRESMRECIAKTLEISVSRVSVKATTTEGLGFTGRGEGIAASALANIRLPI